MTYTYDGNGNMAKSVLNGVITYYVGAHYEKQIQSSQQNVRKYYFAGTSRVAMRENSVLTWLMVDQDNPHLQSLSHAWEREAPSFLAQGEGYASEERLQTTCTPATLALAGSARDAAKPRLGWIITVFAPPSVCCERGYVARFRACCAPKRLLREGYDPVIGHFIQADTIVPEAGSSKAYDRYAYVNHNPVRYNDPGRHLLTVVRIGPRLDPSEGSGKW